MQVMEESLIRRVNEATDRGCIISVLTDVHKAIVSPETRHGFRRCVLDALLQQIRPSFLGLLTESEVKNYFVRIFAESLVEDALISLVHCLRSTKDFFKLQHLITLLDAVERNGLKKILVSSVASSVDDDLLAALYFELSRLLLQIPDLLYNALGSTKNFEKGSSDSNLEIFLTNHYIYLLDSLQSALTDAKQRIEQSADANLRFLAAVLPTLFRGSPKIFQQLIAWLELQSDSPVWERLSARLFTDTSNGVLYAEDVVLHVAIFANSGNALLKLFGDEIVRCRIVRNILFYKMLLLKVFDLGACIPQKLTECLREGSRYEAGDHGAWSSLYADTVVNVASTWSDSVHLAHSSDEQRCYIDNALLWLVKASNDRLRSLVAKRVSECLAQGVQAHLSSADVHRRFRGMYVAEMLTQWLSLGDLHFDYPDEAATSLDDLRCIVEGKNCLMEGVSDFEKESSRRELISSNKIMEMEPTALTDSDDDEFPSYQIPEVERNVKEEAGGPDGQTRVRPPLYIRDCLDDLNEQENYAKFEAAFGALNSLIRKRALAYDEVASELVKRLIFLTDRYKTERFQERRLKMIVSCLVMSPQLVSVVVTVMFSRSCAMFNRYMILEAISKAATEISDNEDEVSKDFDVVMKSDNANKDEEKSWQQVIEERVAARTRRFKGKAKKQKLKRNKFSDVASLFFYPLTAIEQYRPHLDLLHEDHNLLAKIFFVLGHILCCAENCPPTCRMAMTLNQYLVPLQCHGEATVRQAVLFCFCCICLSLSKSVLLEFFSDAIPDWLNYAIDVGKTDTSIACREMARSAVQIIGTRIEADDAQSL